ncbi:hypothetical protein C2G38_2041712 [Gigaspora rosea]|uniref:Uncharacterized protein n=1 Tax=Gigaspora rosea TaxID=44941 RepID=A0A397UYF4_9GLOM|nr:hypothetical protein C2G38_2041712 [Gigaspora rosea]
MRSVIDIENESDIDVENVCNIDIEKETDNDVENVCDIDIENVCDIDIEKESGSTIKKQLIERDAINKNLPIITENLNNMYTSKPEICTRLSKIYGTKTASDIEMPSDI